MKIDRSGPIKLTLTRRQAEALHRYLTTMPPGPFTIAPHQRRSLHIVQVKLAEALDGR